TLLVRLLCSARRRPPSPTLFPYTTLFRSRCSSPRRRRHRCTAGAWNASSVWRFCWASRPRGSACTRRTICRRRPGPPSSRWRRCSSHWACCCGGAGRKPPQRRKWKGPASDAASPDDTSDRRAPESQRLRRTPLARASAWPRHRLCLDVGFASAPAWPPRRPGLGAGLASALPSARRWLGLGAGLASALSSARRRLGLGAGLASTPASARRRLCLGTALALAPALPRLQPCLSVRSAPPSAFLRRQRQPLQQLLHRHAAPLLQLVQLVAHAHGGLVQLQEPAQVDGRADDHHVGRRGVDGGLQLPHLL